MSFQVSIEIVINKNECMIKKKSTFIDFVKNIYVNMNHLDSYAFVILHNIYFDKK